MPSIYKTVKDELPIERVLEEYGMLDGLKRSGNKLYGSCPVHNGDNPKAFSVSLEKGLWNCFTNCGGGSVIDLIMTIESTDAFSAALTGVEILGSKSEEELEENKIKPLEFRLSLDQEHDYLIDRNLEPNTIREFEIGYCSNGIMAGRIAIPIYDINDSLVAYCGRAVDDSEPKYLFPKGFNKSKVVYNLNKVKKCSQEEIIVVEGFFDVFALSQAGIYSVGLMGSSLSYHQKNQLLSLEQRLTLMFDGDDAGKRGMAKAINILQEKRPLKAIYLPENLQPDDFEPEYLNELIF